jgi:hemolysin activation/secretion protein
MKSNLFQLASLPLLIAAAFQASAATPPGISEAVQQAMPIAPPVTKAPPPAVEGMSEAEPPLQSLPGNQSTVTVKGFKFVGNALLGTDQLQAIVADADGKSLSVAQLHEVATRITRLYRDNGYFVARAYVPAQELTGGVVVIRVIEGHYGAFILDHHGRLHQETAQAILDAVKDPDIVSVDTLERAMLVLNDTPGVHVTQVSVSPGEKVGTSDFHVKTEATPAFSGLVAVDNYGSVYTGKNRVSFSGAWDAPTQTGDRLDVFAMTTDHDGLDSGRLGYWHLLTPTGMRGEIALSRTTYSLGNTYSALDAIGHANTVEALVTYPVILTESHRLTAQLGGSYSGLVDEVRSTNTRTPKKDSVVDGGAEYSSVAPDASTQAGAMVTFGHLSIDDSVASAADAAGARTRGDFSKLYAHAERRQMLPGDFELNARIRAQAANKSLDGSNKLEVSGSDGVIVYAPGELLGDDAAVGRVSLSRAFPVGSDVKLAPSVFVDEGWAHNKFAVAGTASSRTLGDVGLGLTASYRMATLSVQWASRTQGGKAVAEPTSSNRLLAQFAVSF